MAIPKLEISEKMELIIKSNNGTKRKLKVTDAGAITLEIVT